MCLPQPTGLHKRGVKTSCQEQGCLPQPTGLRKRGVYKKLPTTHVLASAYWLAQAGGIKEAATNTYARLSLLACASGGCKTSCHQQMCLPQPTGLRKRGLYKKLPPTNVPASAYWLAQAGDEQAANNKGACLSLLACASGGSRSCQQHIHSFIGTPVAPVHNCNRACLF